jgi:hypothetical protein
MDGFPGRDESAATAVGKVSDLLIVTIIQLGSLLLLWAARNCIDLLVDTLQWIDEPFVCMFVCCHYIDNFALHITFDWSTIAIYIRVHFVSIYGIAVTYGISDFVSRS